MPEPPDRRHKIASSKSLDVHFTRLGIVQAAMDVFAQHGAEATRVEDLLEAAGVARRTFYKYFKNKEEVLVALFEVATGKLLEAIQRASLGASDPLAGIRLGLDTYLEFHLDNAALLRVLVEEAIRSGSALASHRNRFQQMLIDTLDRAVQAIDGRRLDPYLYLSLVAALEGLSLHLLQHDGGKEEVARAKAVMHGLVDVVLGGAAPGALPLRKSK